MFYRRHLPHWQKTGRALFITWRLFGSLPRKALSPKLKDLDPGKRFLRLDDELDKALYGPTWLKDPRIAEQVVKSLQRGAEPLQLYRLIAYVVMSNHAHILIWPQALLPRITKGFKGFTARQANRILNRTGERFWQDESFDHSVRNENEFYRIKNYIERNPVKAGLVRAPEEWPWSSASRVK